MGTLIVLLRVCGLLLCWLLLMIRQIAISDASVLVSCLLQESDGLYIYAGQDTERTCLLIFFRDVGF